MRIVRFLRRIGSGIRALPGAVLDLLLNDFWYAQFMFLNLAFQVGMWRKSLGAAVTVHAACMVVFALICVTYRMFKNGVTINFKIMAQDVEQERCPPPPPVIRSRSAEIC